MSLDYADGVKAISIVCCVQLKKSTVVIVIKDFSEIKWY